MQVIFCVYIYYLFKRKTLYLYYYKIIVKKD